MSQGNSMKDRVKEARKALNLTQAEFAERLGFTKSTISQWESGINQIPLATIGLVCSTFGISKAYLVNGDGEMFTDAKTSSPLDLLAREYGLSEDDRMVIEAYCRMPPRHRKAIQGFMDSARGRSSMDDEAYSKT